MITQTKILTILKNLYDTRGDEVEDWLAEQREIAPPFFYSSVDLRHSGVRIAPVDTNLFPAGFQNLSPAARIRATRFIKDFFKENYTQTQKILIVPENHTRNLPYFDNLATLESLIKNAGFEVKIGNLTLENEANFASVTGLEITQYPIAKNARKIATIDGYVPDIIILNNDMTAGIPDILYGVLQPIIPPANMGWFQRRKSTHFAEYHKLIANFSAKFDIDSWLLCAQSYQCGMVDFRDKNSLECLAKSVDAIIATARIKHAEYAIKTEPYVYIKADSGTYGMGIMTVNSGEEVLELNKKERNKMQVIKEGARVSEVIIQEGIPTIDTVDNAPAEPMVYMIDGVPVGGMYRINDKRDAFGNLNAAGMRFTGMCDESEENTENLVKIKDCNFRAHGLIASIAALAAGREKYAK